MKDQNEMIVEDQKSLGDILIDINGLIDTLFTGLDKACGWIGGIGMMSDRSSKDYVMEED